jgi:predicted Zn finger-like uncharacterized protein
MIAACPKCHTRYRVQPEQLGPEGARLRCSQCSAVFRVRVPAASTEAAPVAPASTVEAPAPPARPPSRTAEPVRAPAPPPAAHEGPRFDTDRLVLVAHADPDVCKTVADSLERAGLQVLVAHDGVEAILSIHRALPRAVVLDAALPKMFGFQVCELVKRNESLVATRVVLVGAIHKEDRYRRPPSDLYGADVYLEPHDLEDSLLETLSRLGVPGPSKPQRAPAPFDVPAPVPAPAPPVSAPAPVVATPAPAPIAPAPAPAAVAPAAPADPLAAERAKAERLARIVVSDIVLYNREKFEIALQSGDVVAAMRDELEEGRSLFRERVDAQVRGERDHLAEELQRVARTRGGR